MSWLEKLVVDLFVELDGWVVCKLWHDAVDNPLCIVQADGLELWHVEFLQWKRNPWPACVALLDKSDEIKPRIKLIQAYCTKITQTTHKFLNWNSSPEFNPESSPGFITSLGYCVCVP